MRVPLTCIYILCGGRLSVSMRPLAVDTCSSSSIFVRIDAKVIYTFHDSSMLC